MNPVYYECYVNTCLAILVKSTSMYSDSCLDRAVGFSVAQDLRGAKLTLSQKMNVRLVFPLNSEYLIVFTSLKKEKFITKHKLR